MILGENHIYYLIFCLQLLARKHVYRQVNLSRTTATGRYWKNPLLDHESTHAIPMRVVIRVVLQGGAHTFVPGNVPNVSPAQLPSFARLNGLTADFVQDVCFSDRRKLRKLHRNPSEGDIKPASKCKCCDSVHNGPPCGCSPHPQ